MSKIRIGIVGYGNLGKGVERSIKQNPDMELVAIFSRRDVKTIANGSSKLVNISEIESYKDKVDVMMLCGGSATDLVVQGPSIAKHFNTVDSFDTHAKIPEYFESMDSVSKESGKVSLISTGWDPGLFSLNRLLGQSVLPQGVDYTFWGKGVSQGHSDAIRRVEGVKLGIQYTIPNDEALQKVRAGEEIEIKGNDGHERVCYIVPAENADKDKIEQEIKNMPNYFVGYKTTVNFISEEEFKANHSGMPHGGSVFRSGTTEEGARQIIEFNLKLGSNPGFTSSVATAYARAVYKYSKEGRTGALTVFDIPFAYLSPKSAEELRRDIL
ncbi:meso-diaminopimelate D-dehydrogenase Ddh [Gottschalkia acidurici 9a]|uniref:Meso-diaminopimelate D-dehydrogenase n=1 Tax=Gottschalkia acidurici (strain ATCC 7906 / DSM 604 / BCRC 14475 / CIP 104303 / KCTC 5404 / NCIMB 10678 / 9a) TaxID=1128398 RepID=K0B1G6_GOTA9|nr:diaminopimelate dehydrogenase [Gottschalkia acidurici]AFS79838.1 meso-diaminopimelate D-dehydrogenase Ddh [Gottschalkia acidurici 9a]